ncbi:MULTISPECIES: GGDEF domain-containing protein [unclassified Fusibacter]|uniref:tetratricopeptide repeat-containing diguanylate cyclase n=1 Tax=unclassified Fusibacter TaxID=2624464 RepID=UPI0013E9488C|nr:MULTISPECIES: GGDEF domain-containing protein [unclassified Fusibacter]MCK8058967.1 diguanylate cyclase [Fusibacter sp. A2]NPE22044.1 diguanylate cyclase [Fusibacter sp. A1]
MITKIKTMLDISKKQALENPQASYSLAKEAFALACENDLEIEKANAYYCMAYSCRVMSDYSNGLIYALKALDIFNGHNDLSGILKVRNIIGIVYFYYSDYKSSLENFMIAIEILEKIKDPRLESSVLNNIGEIHRVAEDFEKALDYYKRALEISFENHLEMNIAVIYMNIGQIYYLQKEYVKALVQMINCEEYSKRSNDIITHGEVQTKLGRLMLAQGDYEKAREHYLSALKHFNKVNNRFYMVELLMDFAQLDMAMKLNPKPHLMEALDYAIENNLGSKISEIYKQLIAYHEANDDYKKAFDYFKLYHQKEREIEASNLSMKLELISVEFSYYKEKNEKEQNKLLSEKLKHEVSESKKELQEIKLENEKLIEVSIIDELTQIYNRRGITQMLSQKTSVKGPLMDLVFIIDIDYFKLYNDTWGHVKGDTCLQQITEQLKHLKYEDYFIGRYGGEEFLCYMKVKDKDEAMEIGLKIKESVSSLNLYYDTPKGQRSITVSIGGCIDRMANENLNRYIEEADKCLYQAKSAGRNRVIIA